MTAAEIIAECERRRIRLSLGLTFDVLDFDAPAGAMTSELRYQIVAHKPEIIEELFDREERAALSAGPAAEWVDASAWHRVMNHPAVLELQRLGLFGEVVEVRSGRRESEAA